MQQTPPVEAQFLTSPPSTLCPCPRLSPRIFLSSTHFLPSAPIHPSTHQSVHQRGHSRLTDAIVRPSWNCLSVPGRLSYSEAEQALMFLAGANSVFSGDKLLTTPNPEDQEDQVRHQVCTPNPSSGPLFVVLAARPSLRLGGTSGSRFPCCPLRTLAPDKQELLQPDVH